MGNLSTQNNSKAEKFWVIFMKIIGTVIFVAPLYKPVVAYFKDNSDKVIISSADFWFILGGFFLMFGSKQFGILANNIGIRVNKFLELKK